MRGQHRHGHGGGRRLHQLQVGQEGQVLAVDRTRPGRYQRLAAYGLFPGARVRVEQRFPVLVVEVGHTHLAMEPEVAADVTVEADAPGAAGNPGTRT
ncbi:MAG: ferrous iron transport protein A [Bacillota bacterium]